MIIKNFYPDRLCLDSRLNHLNSICNACLLSFPSREICYDIFKVVVNKNLTKPGNIKTKHYSATDGSGLCLKALLITSLHICYLLNVVAFAMTWRGSHSPIPDPSYCESLAFCFSPGIEYLHTHTHTRHLKIT